jgi:NAD(P)-dependent dehydrogenase (short-subunit alcohol dehydrogenase family)
MKEKVVLVTGASSGIGRAAALKFAAEGSHLALVARSTNKVTALAAEIKTNGGTARPITADLTQESDIERTIEEVVRLFGRLDVLVNAAGIITLGNYEDTSLAQWDALMNVNVRSLFYLSQQAMPHLIESRGSIVNVSSVAGLRAFPGILAYCVSKAAVDQLTRCLALEVADKGVRVNAVNPGVVVTNLHREAGMAEESYAAFLERSQTTHPLGRVGRPEEVADLIYFLASPQAGWITGTTVSIDGGRAQTCAR